jgi:hypothetical protein
MTAALTPALALAYLSELSADVRAAIVLGAGGEPLAMSRGGDSREGSRHLPVSDVAPSESGDAPSAGDAALAAAARALLADAPVVRALTERGGVFGARDELHGVVVVTGPLALPNLAVHDVLSVLAALGGTPSHALVSNASPVAARALLDAL